MHPPELQLYCCHTRLQYLADRAAHDLDNLPYLVALNADTGEIVYQQPINTADGIVVFYMMYAEETLILRDQLTPILTD